MSEADAEDGLHGLDEPLAIKNDTRLNIEFAFFRPLLPKKKPDRAPFPPIQFLKIPPAKKKKHGKAEWGEGGVPSPCLRRVFGRQARGAGRIVRVTPQSERTHWSKATTHADLLDPLCYRYAVTSSVIFTNQSYISYDILLRRRSSQENTNVDS